MKLIRGAIAVIVAALALAPVSLGQAPSVVAKAEPQPASDKATKKDIPAAGDVSPKPAPEIRNDDPLVYRIGVEDELGISVWHEADMSTNAVVRPDGMITLPLLNDLKVTGMTTRELQDMITEKLKEFVKEPQVTIVVRQIRSRKVYLMGEVVRPGTYPLNNSKTVLQLLAEAGGPSAYAKIGSIYVIRQQDGTRKTLPFHYKRAMSGRSLADDITLLPGDMVVVP